MSLRNRAIKLIALVILFICPIAVPGQWDKKQYTEWSEKEAMKLLNDSPWCQTQTFTDSSRASSTSGSGTSRTTVISDIVNVHFRIRFLSAKPVRQAISRFMEIQQKDKMTEQLAARLKGFATGDFPDYIVVTVTVEADKTSNMEREANALLNKLSTSLLKNNTYLLTDGGQRIFLQEYRPPRPDGLGANFIFPRLVNGEPLLGPNSKEVLFHTELNTGSTGQSRDFTLNMRYKVKNMTFNGKLEY
jgi:hypothetical protein